MRHFGIWIVRDEETKKRFGDQLDGWLVTPDGFYFWTTSMAVAEATLKIKQQEIARHYLEVREWVEG